MGHSTTKMLFEIYSRFVPNLTRQDGSAFEKLLSKAQDEHKGGQE
jgi:integrase